MVQTLLEEESEVNGIVDAGKAGFTSEGVQVWSKLLSRTEELLCEGEATAKW